MIGEAVGPIEARRAPRNPASHGVAHMQFDPKTAAARIMRSFAGLRTRLADYIRGMLAARRERLEHEREFYRNLTAYCDEN